MIFSGLFVGFGLISAVFCADALRTMVSTPHIYLFAFCCIASFAVAGASVKGMP